ncbi:unnamed protein product [Sphenostylis stenocarpa]|uniref:Uncharacterized protein n=1 Tax=Sphenostylis stenocarpa TaxID=92480 RepID=A0AA86VM24_9FABA|nr:unnamed protein product [Sphenostylis stenocarpa]
MGHLYLSFALSVSGDLTALANQLEELLPWTIHRSERYYALALCYYGAGKDLVALDLYCEYEIGFGDNVHVGPLVHVRQNQRWANCGLCVEPRTPVVVPANAQCQVLHHLSVRIRVSETHTNRNSFVHLLNLMQLDLRTNAIANDQLDGTPLRCR